MIKNPSAVQENWVQSLDWEDPWRRAWQPSPLFWPGEFQGLYSPWGCQESKKTERLSLSLSPINLWSCFMKVCHQNLNPILFFLSSWSDYICSLGDTNNSRKLRWLLKVVPGNLARDKKGGILKDLNFVKRNTFLICTQIKRRDGWRYIHTVV